MHPFILHLVTKDRVLTVHTKEKQTKAYIIQSLHITTNGT